MLTPLMVDGVVTVDHSEFMVLALQLDVGYREFFLGVTGKQSLAGEQLARVSPTLVATCCSVLPGFAPAGEALLFRQKAPKPLTPRLASWEGRNASLRRAAQLAPLTQGPPGMRASFPWARRQASNHGEKIFQGNTHERARNPIFCMIRILTVREKSRFLLNRPWQLRRSPVASRGSRISSRLVKEDARVEGRLQKTVVPQERCVDLRGVDFGSSLMFSRGMKTAHATTVVQRCGFPIADCVMF